MTRELTYREAARRVDRSVRTIKRWRRAGMPMTFDEAGRRVVKEEILLKWWRERMNNWPTHQWRMRRMKREMTEAADSDTRVEEVAD